jgi:hypothetical protein
MICNAYDDMASFSYHNIRGVTAIASDGSSSASEGAAKGEAEGGRSIWGWARALHIMRGEAGTCVGAVGHSAHAWPPRSGHTSSVEAFRWVRGACRSGKVEGNLGLVQGRLWTWAQNEVCSTLDSLWLWLRGHSH